MSKKRSNHSINNDCHRKKQKTNLFFSQLLNDPQVLFLIFEFGSHEDICEWVRVCKSIYSFAKTYYPGFFELKFSYSNDYISVYCKKGNLDAIKYSLSKHLMIYDDWTFNRIMAKACKFNSLNIVYYFLSLKTNVPFDRQKLLQKACTYGHLDLVKHLTFQGVDIRKTRDLALRTACANGHLEIVKFLISQGASVQINDYESESDEDDSSSGSESEYLTALELAVENEYLSVVKYLVSLGVDIHEKEDRALFISVKNNNLEIIEFIVSINPSVLLNAALLFACEEKNFNLVKHLVSQGADIHYNNDEPLIRSITTSIYTSENLELIKYLVSFGVDIHVHNELPLLRAAISGNLELVKFWISQGAIVSYDIIYESARNGNRNVFDFLIGLL